jgi:hypothetical protein
MISIAPDATEIKFRCPLSSESNFSLELQELEVVLSASSTSNFEIDDGLFQRNVGSSARYDAKVYYVPEVGDVTIPNFFSSNPSIATVGNNGNVTTVGSGNVDIFCRAFQTTKKVVHNARTVTPTTTDIFLNYLEGTLGEHSTHEVNAIISSGGELNLFSVKNPQTPIYTRNPTCWASSLDWTGVSPHNSAGGFQRGGTLISPRHLIWANHFNIPNGTTMTFVSAENQIVTRTLTNSLQISSSDIRVGVLNSDIGASVSHYSVLPSNWDDYLVTVSQTYIPLVTTDQEQKAICRELSNISITAHGGRMFHRLAQVSPRQNFSENIVVGDSGRPMFMIINGEMVFLGCHYNTGAIVSLHEYITEINAAMTTLGGGYQLTQVDLSGFTDFSS